MPLSFRNLDEKTRTYMVEEIRFDIERNALYLSDRLNETGKGLYPQLLIQSAESGNDTDLAYMLRNKNCFNAFYARKKLKGGYTQVKMPITAPESLAEGEFNRFYIRGLCRLTIDEKAGTLKVYRARYSKNPRYESEQKIGQVIDAEKLLADLRNNIGIDTFLGIPAGPNSGLSVELV